ncbi:MAG: hypothetical protein H6779_00155 [Candidatus Nomurabacteria bacterium]|nr:MAG: hypothetical protein H6779_00155 [Candidatus Nomurabacteria bacterium]
MARTSTKKKGDKPTRTKKPMKTDTKARQSTRAPKSDPTIKIKSSLKQPTKAKPKVATKSKKAEAVVSLPPEISPVMQAKADRYRHLFDLVLPKVMLRTAYIGGFLFVSLGFALSFYALNYSKGNFNLSATICTTTDCTSTSSTTSSTDTTSQSTTEKSSVSFASNFDTKPQSDFTTIITTKSVHSIAAFVIAKDTNKATELSARKISETQYELLIPVNSLPVGDYYIKVKATALDTVTIYTFSGPGFSIVRETNTDNSAATETTMTNTVDSDNGNSDPMLIQDTTNESSMDSDSTVSNTTNDNPITLEPVSSLSEDSEFETSDIIEPTPLTTLNRTGEPGLYYLNILSPEAKFVEVYTKPELSSTRLFLGLATLRDKYWVFLVDGSKLPVGKYLIITSSFINGNMIESKPLPFTVTADYYTDEDSRRNNNEAETAILTERVKSALNDNTEDFLEDSSIDTNLLEQRTDYYNAPEDSSTYSNVDLGPREISVDLNESELNNLLKKYASALQSRDGNLIRLAEDSLDEFESDVLKPTDDTDLDTNNTDLSNFFDELKAKVARYEDIISVRSELINKDSDQDGISDFDEATLYKTDPFTADTDMDGFIDSVEILRGYDPLDPNPEAATNYKSPKDVNYIDEDRLVIQSIAPVIQVADETLSDTPIQAEIKGKALPSSFVTLYVYSSPTIITIKTDSDGNFAYTFDKELEDGQHEVYLAITDNTGSIVARSEPYRFVKTAEAFTTESNTASAANTPKPLINESFDLSAYGTSAALGIVSFGLILLMIAQTLRLRPEEDEPQVQHETKT